jgi:hypothetical protein
MTSAKTIRPDDWITPRPLWNATTGNKGQHFAEKVRVWDVDRHAVCDTGVLLEVMTLDGSMRRMSAAWFMDKDGKVFHY